jgi:branched-chain amino acid transport system substrate-binding protein
VIGVAAEGTVMPHLARRRDSEHLASRDHELTAWLRLAKVGVTGSPTYAEQFAYLTMGAFVAGLKATGPQPTRQSFIKAMSQIKNFDADGLLAPEKINFRDYTPVTGCLWVARLIGKHVSAVPGTPICAPLVKFTS